MPSVDSTILIQAPLERVYEIAKDNASFPEFMKDVKSLVIVESDGSRIVSDWVGIVPKFMLKVKWRQEDVWDDVAHTCTFRQLQGDYDLMEGLWSFTQTDTGTQFVSHLDYEYNVPTIGALVKKVIHGIVTENMANVLEAIKKRAESAT